MLLQVSLRWTMIHYPCIGTKQHGTMYVLLVVVGSPGGMIDEFLCKFCINTYLSRSMRFWTTRLRIGTTTAAVTMNKNPAITAATHVEVVSVQLPFSLAIYFLAPYEWHSCSNRLGFNMISKQKSRTKDGDDARIYIWKLLGVRLAR